MSKRKFVIVADEASDKIANGVIILAIGIASCVILRSPTAWYAILACIGMLIMWELIEIKHRLRRKM
jgi:hypothetical protein